MRALSNDAIGRALQRDFAPASLGDAIGETLAALIIRGELQSGARITETQVAKQLATSRAPVRQAFQALSNQGLLDLNPRKGAMVARLDPSDASHLYESRMLLEPECDRLAVPLLTDEDIETLSGHIQRMEAALSARDSGRYLSEIVEYSELLKDRCPNEVLRSLVNATWKKSLRYWNILVRLPTDYNETSLGFHLRLHGAVVEYRSEDVAQLSHDLLAFALDSLLTHFNQQDALADG